MSAHSKVARVEQARERKRVLMRGTVYAPSGAHLVWIRDVSRTGALVNSESALTEDCDVIFKRGPIFAAAQVVWTKGTTAGLQFYRPLPDDKLLLATVQVPGQDH
jgi:hypothetical protein